VSRKNVFSLQAKDPGKDEETFLGKGPGVDRRGSIMTLLGTAASIAMGDVVLNTAVKATGAAGSAAMTAGSGLYDRVLAFGNRYRGAAVASEELTTWIATQKVAATPEIRAWLAAQRKLQMARKTTMAATAALTRAKNTKRAATVAGSGILEEGLLAGAATAAVKSFFRADKKAVASSTGTSTEPGISAAASESTNIEKYTKVHSTISEGTDPAKMIARKNEGNE